MAAATASARIPPINNAGIERPLNAPRLNPLEPEQDNLADIVSKKFQQFLHQQV